MIASLERLLHPLGNRKGARQCRSLRNAPRDRDPRGAQPGRRRSRTTTSSSADRPLVEALRREGADWAEDAARELGAICGRRARRSSWGVEANENPPRLRTHDRFGNRIDEVEFHPAWHELMRLAVAHGLHALAVDASRGPGAHVARAAAFMLLVAGRGRASAARSR